MHQAAWFYVADNATPDPVRVVEFGSLNINGSVRGLFPQATYWGIDVVPGDGVDEVADAATWSADEPVDVVVCCEVLEHAPEWREIIANAARNLVPGGTLIMTAAGPGRPEHSAVDGAQLRPDEYYANVDPDELADALKAAGLVEWDVSVLRDDVRATALKGS